MRKQAQFNGNFIFRNVVHVLRIHEHTYYITHTRYPLNPSPSQPLFTPHGRGVLHTVDWDYIARSYRINNEIYGSPFPSTHCDCV